MKRSFCICTLVVLAVLLLPMTVFAADQDMGFSVSFRTDEEVEQFAQSHDDVTLFFEEPEKMPISCFSVNQYGWYALGFETSPKRIVSVYNATGEFIYGYEFECSGTFAIALSDEGNLSIYYCRSDLIVTYSPDGQCMHVADVPGTSENRKRSYEVLNSGNCLEIGDRTYFLDREIDIGSDFSRLVLRYPDEEEVILYDATSSNNWKRILNVAYILGIFGFAFYMLGKELLKHIREDGTLGI